jgi:RNA 2',3'-cyclic 3'-phosphodiesterase
VALSEAGSGRRGPAASARDTEPGYVPHMRLFAAVDLPDDVRHPLAAWGTACAEVCPQLRPVAEERLHLTLVFLGSRPDEEAEGFAALVAGCADGPVDVALGDVLWLAPRRPHVLTVALHDASGALAALQARVADALDVHEDRPFRPHVTVARVRKGARVRPSEVELPPLPAASSFGLEALALYRSHLGPRPRYEALSRVALV